MLGQIVEWAEARGITKQKPDASNFVKNVVSELGEFLNEERRHSEIDAICDIMVFCITELPKYGIDPNLALTETLKEIASRTGEWSPKEGKWLKYKTPEAKALWYTADYDKCAYPEYEVNHIEVPERDMKAQLEIMREGLLEETHLS